MKQSSSALGETASSISLCASNNILISGLVIFQTRKLHVKKPPLMESWNPQLRQENNVWQCMTNSAHKKEKIRYHEQEFVNYETSKMALHGEWLNCKQDISVFLKLLVLYFQILLSISAPHCPLTYLRCLPLRASITTLWKAILKSSLGGLKVLGLIYGQSTGTWGNVLPIITGAGYPCCFVSAQVRFRFRKTLLIQWQESPRYC